MERFGWLIGLIGVIWVLQVVNLITGYTLNGWFGLQPRSFGGLDGILFMPILHGSLTHLIANTVPLAILGGMLAVTAQRVAFAASGIVVGLGGVGVWVFGRNAVHVGASGLIFGWLGFLVARGFVEKRAGPVITAIAVALIYGTMVWGVLPGHAGVSWESHLFGAIAGVIAAFVLRSDARG